MIGNSSIILHFSGSKPNIGLLSHFKIHIMFVKMSNSEDSDQTAPE